MKFSQKMRLYFFYTMVQKVKNDQKFKSRGPACLKKKIITIFTKTLGERFPVITLAQTFDGAAWLPLNWLGALFSSSSWSKRWVYIWKVTASDATHRVFSCVWTRKHGGNCCVLVTSPLRVSRRPAVFQQIPTTPLSRTWLPSCNILSLHKSFAR